jgi:hypothetical protein
MSESLFATGPDGRDLFVTADAVMGRHALLIACCDGTSLTYFGDDGPYLRVEDALAWAEGECRDNLQWAVSVGDAVLAALRETKRKFDAGLVRIND